MKFVKRSAFALAMGSLLISQTGCFGEFALVRKVYNWNDSVSDSKFVKSLLFWGMSIIPVYAIAGFADIIIFNLIEFWGGTNPIAMNEGDHEMQLVTVKGEQFRMEATKDTFTTTQLTGKKAGEVRVMRYDRCDRTWKYTDSNVEDLAVMTFLDDSGDRVRVYTNEGTADLNTADLGNTALVLSQLETAVCAK